MDELKESVMKDVISEKNKIHFAVMAIEASSQKMNISPIAMM